MYKCIQKVSRLVEFHKKSKFRVQVLKHNQNIRRGHAHACTKTRDPPPGFEKTRVKHFDFDKQAEPETLDTGSSPPRQDGETVFIDINQQVNQ